ncbi:chemokine-like factor isoform 1-T1 [Lycaon pictus]
MSTLKPKPKHRPFCFSVKGHVKMLRLALNVTSMTFFIIAQAPEPYIVITGFEVTVTFFFILLYILRLDRIMDCLFWPLLDIINSAIAAIFMIIISVLSLLPETTTFIVLGGAARELENENKRILEVSSQFSLRWKWMEQSQYPSRRGSQIKPV